jgi:hypothetical protein
MDEIRAYVLDPADVERIREAGGPLADQPDLSKLAEASIPVVEVNGRIVAYWPCFYALHLEPLWIAEDHRKSAAVNRGLLECVAAVVQRTGEPVGFAIIDSPTAESYALAERIGFARVPGDLYYVIVPALEPVGG